MSESKTPAFTKTKQWPDRRSILVDAVHRAGHDFPPKHDFNTESRLGMITGSVTSNILGLFDYTGKKGEEEAALNIFQMSAFNGNEFTMLGQLMEPVILEKFENWVRWGSSSTKWIVEGYDPAKPVKSRIHPSIPFFAATLDGFLCHQSLKASAADIAIGNANASGYLFLSGLEAKMASAMVFNPPRCDSEDAQEWEARVAKEELAKRIKSYGPQCYMEAACYQLTQTSLVVARPSLSLLSDCDFDVRLEAILNEPETYLDIDRHIFSIDDEDGNRWHKQVQQYFEFKRKWMGWFWDENVHQSDGSKANLMNLLESRGIHRSKVQALVGKRASPQQREALTQFSKQNSDLADIYRKTVFT